MKTKSPLLPVILAVACLVPWLAQASDPVPKITVTAHHSEDIVEHLVSGLPPGTQYYIENQFTIDGTNNMYAVEVRYVEPPSEAGTNFIHEGKWTLGTNGTFTPFYYKVGHDGAYDTYTSGWSDDGMLERTIFNDVAEEASFYRVPLGKFQGIGGANVTWVTSYECDGGLLNYFRSRTATTTVMLSLEGGDTNTVYLVHCNAAMWAMSSVCPGYEAYPSGDSWDPTPEVNGFPYPRLSVSGGLFGPVNVSQDGGCWIAIKGGTAISLKPHFADWKNNGYWWMWAIAPVSPAEVIVAPIQPTTSSKPGAVKNIYVKPAPSGVNAEALRFGRDEDGYRYNSIYSKSDDMGNASMTFKIHDGADAETQADVLTLQGNGSTIIGGPLKFAGTTSSYPMLKRNNAEIQARLADDSGYASLTAGTLTCVAFSATNLRASVASGGTTTIDCDSGVGTYFVTTTGATVTLPVATGHAGRVLTVKVVSGATSATVSRQNSETIDGNTSYSLSAVNKYVTAQSDGSNWKIIGNN